MSSSFRLPGLKFSLTSNSPLPDRADLQPVHDDHRGNDEAHVLSLRLALGSILSPVSLPLLRVPTSVHPIESTPLLPFPLRLRQALPAPFPFLVPRAYLSCLYMGLDRA